MRTIVITWCLATAGVLIGIGGAGVELAGSQAHAFQVYTVAQVRQRMATHPAAWEGKTVIVRGLAEPCPWWDRTEVAWHCAGRLLVLAPGPADAPALPLPLVRAPTEQPAGFLRDLPVLGRLLPRPSSLPMFAPARFRVRLLGKPVSACGEHGPCYEAQWLEVTRDP